MNKKILIAVIIIFSTTKGFAQLENIPLLTVTGESVIKAKPEQIIMKVNTNKKLNLNDLRNLTTFNKFEAVEIKIKVILDDEDELIVSIDKLLNIGEELYIEREFYITINDPKEYPNVILQVLNSGFKNISVIDFRVNDPAKYKEQALIIATRNAKDKAQILANEIGQKIGAIHLIEEIQVPLYNWYTNPMYVDSILINNEIVDFYLIEPGYITFPAKVKLSFDLIK